MDAMTPEELAALGDAFRRAEYRIEVPGGPPVLLHIGVPSAALDEALHRVGVRTWAVVTAWNPGSRPRPDDENRQAQRSLEERIAREGGRFWPARNQAEGGAAFVEPSVFLLDVTLERAAALGRDFGQVAVVWGEAGRSPRLLSCARGRDL